MKKLAHFPRLIFVFIFLLTYAIAYFCKLENPILRTVLAIILAFVLSPRKKIVQTQTGEVKQVTWIFLKKPIILD